MTSLPQPLVRSQRVRLPDITPVVLRFSNGHRAPVELSIVSLTGGLLRVPKPVAHGARVSMMFLTHRGPVIGQAELLNPVSWTEQPFRFVALQADDQRRLRAAIQATVPAAALPAIPAPPFTSTPAAPRTTVAAVAAAPTPTFVPSLASPRFLIPAAPAAESSPAPAAAAAGEEIWIEKYRAAMDAPAPRGKLRAVLAVLGLATIGLAGFVYFFTPHLLK